MSIQAVALANGYGNSSEVTATYTVNLPVVTTPSFSLAAGTYATAQSVSITDTTPSAAIYYTTDGTTPNASPTLYRGSIEVSSSETINAIAIAPDYANSVMGSATYIVWPASALNEWAWMGGLETSSGFPAPVFGSLGVPAPGNLPGARKDPSAWTDSSGNFWLFGGLGFDENDYGPQTLNDLWEFNPATDEWAWMGGTGALVQSPKCLSGGCGASGIYGTLGTAAATNMPGGRLGAANWTDSKGNFWLFGGWGNDAAGTDAFLNDLWEFTPSTGEWTWMGGSSTVTGVCFGNDVEGRYCGGQPGVYGELGTAATANIPPGRYQATTWADDSGNFWLFGGYTIDSTLKAQYDLNDLWKFNPSASEWTWMGGSSNAQGSDCQFDPNSYLLMCGQPGVSGSLGVSSKQNLPGGRYAALSWNDTSGNLWMMGGAGFDDYGNFSVLNGIWEFNPATDEWTWVGGSSAAPMCSANWNDCGVGALSPVFGSNGTLGVPAASNIPGILASVAKWTDKGGNLWLFSGGSAVSGLVGGAIEFGGGWNDVWELNIAASEWAWVGGTAPNSPAGTCGVYGELGTPATGNIPGARAGAAAWTDKSGDLWMFGGYGSLAGFCASNFLNDMWEYRPSAPNPIPSFAVVAEPNNGVNASVSLAAGTSGTLTIGLLAAGGFNSPVTLSASGLPGGATAAFSPATVTGIGSSRMMIAMGNTTPTGTYTVTVTGTSGGTTENSTVSLTVTAPPPTFAIGASPTSLTVGSGGQGSVTLTVTPQNGFNSTVGFACSGLPSGASCSFSPSTVTPSGNAATTQLTISASAHAANQRRNSQPFLPTTVLAAAVCLISWKKRRRGLQLLLLVVAFTALGLISACGGGSGTGGGGGGGGGGSRPVTYTVTVTATSNSVQQTTAISLTVN